MKNALDAGVSKQFSAAFKNAKQKPVEKEQQALLEEIRNFSNSLKDTILDKDESKSEPKLDKETQQFLLETIKKQLNTEKLKQKQSENLDQKLKKIDSKQQINNSNSLEDTESSSSANNPKKNKVSQSKVKLSKFPSTSNQEEVHQAVSTHSPKKENNRLEEQQNVMSSNTQSFLNSINEVSRKLEILDKEKTQLAKKTDKIEKKQNSLDSESKKAVKKILDKKRDLQHESERQVEQIRNKFDENKVSKKSNKTVVSLQNIVVEKAKITQILQRQGPLKQDQSKEAQIAETNLHTKKYRISSISKGKTPEYKKKIEAQVENLVRNELSKKSNVIQENKQTHKSGKKLINQTKISLISKNTKSQNKQAKLKEIIKFSSNTQEQQVNQESLSSDNIKLKKHKAASYQKNEASRTESSVDSSKLATNLQNKLDKSLGKIKTKPIIDQTKPTASNHSITNNKPGFDDEEQVQSSDNIQQNMNTQIPEELQTAAQWMAEEEVENKIVELLSRQAKLRGVDLS